MRQQRKQTPKVFGPSKTIPGQSLLPAELLKRHLAGTLPDIDQSSKMEYHYDDQGNKIAEPLPMEMHELHTLAVALRKRQFEEATKTRASQAQKFRDSVIEEYKKTQLMKESTPEIKTTLSKTEAPEGKAS